MYASKEIISGEAVARAIRAEKFYYKGKSYSIASHLLGGEAITYELFYDKTCYWLKIFHKEDNNRHLRYEHLKNTNIIPYEFEYIPAVSSYFPRIPLEIKKKLGDGAIIEHIPFPTWTEIMEEGGLGKKQIQCAIALSKAIKKFEENNIAHRDLSCGNVLIEIEKGIPYIIDWDQFFMPSITSPQKLKNGTPGYKPVSYSLSYSNFSDRYALSILIMEFMTIVNRQESPLFNENELLECENADNAQKILNQKCIFSAKDVFSEKLRKMAIKTLSAKTFQEMTQPEEWLDVLVSFLALKEKKRERTDWIVVSSLNKRIIMPKNPSNIIAQEKLPVINKKQLPVLGKKQLPKI